eukprot:4328562-Pyramimonas_sp.AAC.1
MFGALDSILRHGPRLSSVQLKHNNDHCGCGGGGRGKWRREKGEERTTRWPLVLPTASKLLSAAVRNCQRDQPND